MQGSTNFKDLIKLAENTHICVCVYVVAEVHSWCTSSQTMTSKICWPSIRACPPSDTRYPLPMLIIYKATKKVQHMQQISIEL